MKNQAVFTNTNKNTDILTKESKICYFSSYTPSHLAMNLLSTSHYVLHEHKIQFNA